MINLASYMVYVAEQATWSATSLEKAKELAEAYVDGRRSLKIVGRGGAMGEQCWVYDYRDNAWIECAPSDAALNAASPGHAEGARNSS